MPITGIVLSLLVLGWTPGHASSAATEAIPGTVGSIDYNGDGFADLAVGVTGEAIGGGVNVLYGSDGGLTAAGNQFWSQDSPGVAGAGESGDSFGYALAHGDFDGDGFTDLAVGVPFEDIETIQDAGGVNVLYGSSDGLTAAENQFWSQDSAGVVDVAESEDRFGLALASGDFNSDFFTDLAVGVPAEDIEALHAGGVNVLYGSADGLTAAGSQFWTQDSPGVVGVPETGDGFGWSLASGLFMGNGFADLAVGVPGESIGTVELAGGVNMLYGSAGGLTATGNQFVSQDSPGVVGVAELEDRFGWSLASGNFNGDLHFDLAVGVPGEDVATSNSGGVSVLYGSSGGLTATGNQFVNQDSPGVAGVAEGGDTFGAALAGGNLNGDGFTDLAVGVPYEDIRRIRDAGGVNVLYGSSRGLTATGNQFVSQDSPGVVGVSETADRFGSSLAIRGFNGDLFADLAVGVPREAIGAVSRAGGANVLYGSSGGLTATGDQFISQDSPGVVGVAEQFDHFGTAVTAG